MSDRVLVDTKVLYYAFSGDPDPRAVTARAVLEDLMRSDRLVSSTQVLQELFVTLTRKGGASVETAVSLLDDLAAWPVFRTDYDAIREAALVSGSARISFWDALVVTAAARMGAEELYSEDLSHGQVISGVRIVNPFAG